MVTYEWDASLYERLGAPQLALAQDLIARIPKDIAGNIIDAGCGNGLVTEALLHARPQCTVLAIDSSSTMLEKAKHRLSRHKGRVELMQADLQHFVRPDSAECVFSNATLHWVAHHEPMFHNFFASLHPGGALVAQFACCGPRTQPFAEKMDAITRRPPFARYFEGWHWSVGDITEARERTVLTMAGFEAIDIQVKFTQMPFGPEDLPAFMQNIVLHEHSARLPTAHLRDMFTRAGIEASAETHGPGGLGYESLVCYAHRPSVGELGQMATAS